MSSTTLSSSPKPKNLPVTAVDQANINRFSYVAFCLGKLSQHLDTLQNTISNQNEALEELELMDEQATVPVRMGSAFFHLPVELAQREAQRIKYKAVEELVDTKKKMDTYQAELKVLKETLQGKFGDSIRLE